ncbi:MAG: glycosyltransferase [Spirochaetales bacterium]|nr:glycosyltransferase [Spirochaetales bacterium]
MNIGFFTECWDPQINGVITSIKNLQYELIKRHNSIYVFAPHYKNHNDNDPHIFRQWAIKYFFQPEFNFASLLKFKALRKARQWNLDLVHSHTEFSLGIIASGVAKQLNLPFVLTFHTLWEFYSHYFLWDILPQNMFRYILSLLYKSPDYFIAPSEKVKTYLETIMSVTATIKVIPTGLNLNHFFDYDVTPHIRREFRKKYGMTPDDKVMVFVGRIGKEKSVDVLIRGLAQLMGEYPHLKLLVVGGGPGIPELQRLAKKHHVEHSVIFTGYIPWEHIPLAYKSSDIFVLASVSETQGLVTVEALACGLPIIVRKDQANLDIIGNGRFGLVFNKPEEFPAAVKLLLSHPELEKDLKAKAQKASLKYSVEQFGKQVLEYYNWIIEDHKGKMSSSAYR